MKYSLTNQTFVNFSDYQQIGLFSDPSLFHILMICISNLFVIKHSKSATLQSYLQIYYFLYRTSTSTSLYSCCVSWKTSSFSETLGPPEY